MKPVTTHNNADIHERYGEARKVRLSLYDGGEKRDECGTVAVCYPSANGYPNQQLVFRGTVKQARELAERLGPVIDAWFFAVGGRKPAQVET